MADNLLPNKKEYCIVHRDRWKPLGHPDEEVKQYETDNLDDVPLPSFDGISVIAYQSDGTIVELTDREGDKEGQDRISSSMDDVQTDG